MDTSISSHKKKDRLGLIISMNFKRVLHLMRKKFDRKTPKISQSEIPTYEKSLEKCPEIVLYGVFIKDIQQYIKYMQTN